MHVRAGYLFLVVLLLTIRWSLAQRMVSPFLDASHDNLQQKKVQIENWAYYPKQFIGVPETANTGFEAVELHKVFNKIEYGTFATAIFVNPQLKNTMLAIEVPAIFSSYKLSVNGKGLGGKGKVGKINAACVPEPGPAIYSFKAAEDTLTVTLQAANFFPSPGGLQGPLVIGSDQFLRERAATEKFLDYSLFLVLVLIGVVSFVLFYISFNNREVYLLLFFFTLSWLLRCLFGYHYRILEWVDLPWAVLMRVEYLSMILTTVFAMLFISRLFPNDFKRIVRNGAVLCCGLFIMSIGLLSPQVFIPLIGVYLGFSCVLLTYSFFVISKAFVDDRGGATIMLATMLMGSAAFGYAILSYFGFLEMNMILYDIAFMILGVMLLISVSVRLSKMDRLSEARVLTMEHFFSETRK